MALAGERVAWKVTSWAQATDLSKSYIYEMINSGELETLKYNGVRLIVTSPSEWIERERAKSAAVVSESPKTDLSTFAE